MPLDATHTPLRPAILYGIDARASGEIEELTELYPATKDVVHDLAARAREA